MRISLLIRLGEISEGAVVEAAPAIISFGFRDPPLWRASAFQGSGVGSPTIGAANRYSIE